MSVQGYALESAYDPRSASVVGCGASPGVVFTLLGSTGPTRAGCGQVLGLCAPSQGFKNGDGISSPSFTSTGVTLSTAP